MILFLRNNVKEGDEGKYRFDVVIVQGSREVREHLDIFVPLEIPSIPINPDPETTVHVEP